VKTTLKYRTEEEMEFPDEVDTPIDVPARERFSKYKGLASMKQGSWDPMENLPKEYANVYSFENIKNTYKQSIQKAHEEGMKISGNYIKLTIKDFAKEDLIFIRNDTPLIVSTLLQHERKLCVMHYKISLNYENEDIIKAKNPVETHIGFRRIITKPIFSNNITANNKSDKMKIEKQLIKDKFYIASVYSQLTYYPSPIMLFNLKNKIPQYVGGGGVLDTDCKRIVLKKIILTGYPVKVKKKKAVVRYMFFNPNDVHYFKPVQLSTKNGLKGHITESLGTHGLMKCIFNDHIKQSDTICLELYKRVFPKWFKESWKYKIFYGNRTDYEEYYKKENKEIDENKMID